MLQNGLVPNLDKINIIKFIMNNSPHCALRIGCEEKYVEETGNRIFFLFTNVYPPQTEESYQSKDS